MTTHPSGAQAPHAESLEFQAAAIRSRRCGCDTAHRCDAALDAICIPEEDSRLSARARIDFGQVPIAMAFSATIAGNFNIRIHVPRSLQLQISGNSLVGSVLGNARISADISARVGSIVPGHCDDTEVCLFIGFHEERRGTWLVDLRVLCGSRLRVPVRIDASLAAVHDKVLPAGVVFVVLEFHQDALVRRGPITIPGGSVLDLWRSIRDQVRHLLVEYIESITKNDVVRIHPEFQGSLCSETGESSMERLSRMAC